MGTMQNRKYQNSSHYKAQTYQQYTNGEYIYKSVMKNFGGCFSKFDILKYLHLYKQ